MGTYPDTNNQFAYKTDPQGFLNRLRDRATDLFLDDYRVMPFLDEPNTFLVYREEQGDRGGYKVNPVTETCTCRFFLDQEKNPLEPGETLPCKHLLGLPDLLENELRYWAERYTCASGSASPLNGSAKRADVYRGIGSRLFHAWKETEEELRTNCTSYDAAERFGLLCGCALPGEAIWR